MVLASLLSFMMAASTASAEALIRTAVSCIRAACFWASPCNAENRACEVVKSKESCLALEGLPLSL